MRRKLTALFAPVLVFAAVAAAPALAQAAVELESPPGTHIGPGAPVTLHIGESVIGNLASTTVCEPWELGGKIIENPDAVIEFTEAATSGCASIGGLKITPSFQELPTRLELAKADGYGVAALPIAIKFSGPAFVCEYTGKLRIYYSPNSENIGSLTINGSPLTKVGEAVSNCEKHIYLTSSGEMTSGGNQMRAVVTGPYLFKKGAGPLLVGDEIKFSSSDFVIDASGAAVECTDSVLTGPIAGYDSPARVSITNTSFSEGGERCATNMGLVAEVSTNVAEGWNLNFSGPLSPTGAGSIRFTTTFYSSWGGEKIATCVYGASSLSASLFEVSASELTLVSSVPANICPESAVAEGHFTLTANGQPVELITF